MTLKAIFDKDRRAEIRKAIARGEPVIRRPQKTPMEEESVIDVDERDIILIDSPPAAASANKPTVMKVPLPQALIPPAGAQPSPAPHLTPPPLIQSPAAASKRPYNEQRALDEELIDAFEKDEKGRMEAVLARGANVDAKDRLGRTCLMRAAQGGDFDMLVFLYGKSAFVNDKDNEGQTALAYAAKSGSHNAADSLIFHTAEIDARDKHRRTPLMHAAIGGNLTVAKVLIRHHADALAKDENHATALWHAQNPPKRPELVEYLKECEREARIQRGHPDGG
jgi:ankyrin repeat protein